jgi:hypothetical protein
VLKQLCAYLLTDRLAGDLFPSLGKISGSTVVKVRCNKSEGRWFDASWWHWNYFIDIISFRLHYGPGVDPASNRNECQEYFLGVKAVGA